MIDEIRTILTTYHGLQISVEVLHNGRWRYLGFGVSEVMVDVVYGTATDAEVSDTLRKMALSCGERPARYAAGHMEHCRKLFEYERVDM